MGNVSGELLNMTEKANESINVALTTSGFLESSKRWKGKCFNFSRTVISVTLLVGVRGTSNNVEGLSDAGVCEQCRL